MRGLVATVSVLGLVCCSGCMSTVARRGLAEVRGASGDVYPIQAFSPATAKGASTLKIGQVQIDGSGAAEFRTALQTQLNKQLAAAIADRKITPGSGEPLTINSTVRFYSSKGGSKLIGGMAFVIVRVEIVDKDGKVVGKADALASTQALRTGTEDLAKELGKKVIAWAGTGKT